MEWRWGKERGKDEQESERKEEKSDKVYIYIQSFSRRSTHLQFCKEYVDLVIIVGHLNNKRQYT